MFINTYYVFYLDISPAKTTVFTFLEVKFIHCIYLRGYPQQEQRNEPARNGNIDRPKHNLC